MEQKTVEHKHSENLLGIQIPSSDNQENGTDIREPKKNYDIRTKCMQHTDQHDG